MIIHARVFYTFFTVWLNYRTCFANGHSEIHFKTVEAWSVKLGTEMFQFGEFITRRKEVQESFKSAQVETRDGNKLVQSIADDIQSMMELKISAVRRIVENAENMALSKQQEPVPPDFRYHNSKDMKPESQNSTLDVISDDNENVIPRPPSLDANLEPNPHFLNIAVNTSLSSVHVPGYVYAWAPEVIKGIYWSEGLKDIFISNYQSDPTLSWQYFGSSTGFMRHYPAKHWEADPVDIYDCRTRAWYMEAAASPKDMVILVDRSGSMTGHRRDIAKHVVTNILDTLGTNDFFTVLTFSETVEEVVPCFEGSLVQATLANIREVKLGLDTYVTEEIANFTAALTTAFELLYSYREFQLGANCNQAIMLVTDGVPYNFKEIFETWNWPHMPARVFTYLIGREVKVAEVREVKWMACANRGFYVHLSTLAEVRERVLEHVNVMARPLVLQREVHPVLWSPVYANITDPKVADYLWEQKERKEQKENIMAQRRNKKLFNSAAEQERRMRIKKMKHGLYSESSNQEYQLMTSVSMPVYDRRDYEVRIANLLGVAGTDVPLTELHALMNQYRVGVNGYAFIVTNNGFILTHPDLRPVYQQILKPSYNSIDITEIELVDDDRDPRNFSTEWIALRQEIIDQRSGSTTIKLKFHYDGMRRVKRETRQYFWRGIPGSPWTLVLSLSGGPGQQRLVPLPTEDIHRAAVSQHQRQYLLRHHKWTIHPEWLYCKHYEKKFSSAEDQLLYFLERMSKPLWRWPLKPRPPEQQHSHSNNSTSGKIDLKAERDYYYCDHDLMQSLVFDARNTEWFNQNISISVKDNKGKDFIQRFGHTVAFMATHSGLTRWQTFPKPSEHEDEGWVPSDWSRAVDLPWYSRAARRGGSWVFWARSGRVSGVAAALVGDSSRSAPLEHALHSPVAAVVGFTVEERRLAALMMSITNITCGDSKNCSSCHSDDIDCYLVDDNGWIVVGEKEEESDKFFGNVHSDIMEKLVEDEVFQAVHIVDYQAICFVEKGASNPGSFLAAPLKNLRQLISWLGMTALWLWKCVLLASANADSYTMDDVLYQTYENDDGPYFAYESEPASKAKERDFDKLVIINRTRPTPCDREMFLYELSNENIEEKMNRNSKGCERPYVVQMVKHTNLLLIVVDAKCPSNNGREWGLNAAKEIIYNKNYSLPCFKYNNPLPRVRPKSCISNHTNESSIDMCGGGWNVHGQSTSTTIATLLTIAISLIIS